MPRGRPKKAVAVNSGVVFIDLDDVHIQKEAIGKQNAAKKTRGRPKKDVKGAASKSIDVADVDVQKEVVVKRSTRKRKQVSYVEIAVDDKDNEVINSLPAPKKPKMAKAAAAASQVTGATEAASSPIVIEDDAPKVEAPKVKTAVAKKKSKSRSKYADQQIEYDEHGRESRQREYVHEPNDKYWTSKHRAGSKKHGLSVQARTRCGDDGYPEEMVEVAGSSGNLYTVHIKLIPTCNCMDAKTRGNQCKHLAFVKHCVLKAHDSLAWQEAFTSDELRMLFENAPIPEPSAEDLSNDGKRKPIDGSDCFICYSSFEEGEATDYCKAACGNNVHKACIDQWIQALRTQYKTPTCPYCRTEWMEKLPAPGSSVLARAQKGPEGYKNIARDLGISNKRDWRLYRDEREEMAREFEADAFRHGRL
ncbi:hypothetical protein BCR34DRAFT_615853 [Clohesyomyces aquaticus]|uniref:SWIM-type domain-containing protein n=1 Tax=Clohesyomyces aquaticus TaxID=1231657 RepID=A0A1Y1ZGN0_9PLEO|nr:hypothetical protein BCR34DRAFT_615853 [Clohesyomyces aquaticus]